MIFNGNEFSAASELQLRLALPQLVTLKSDAITNFINAKPIGGNTFKVNIDNVLNTEALLKEAIIKTNNDASQSNVFDNLQIIIKYRLGNNGSFEDAKNLQRNLANSTVTKINNSLWMKIELNHQTTDFELDEEAAKEHKLYDNNNDIIIIASNNDIALTTCQTLVHYWIVDNPFKCQSKKASNFNS